MAYSAVDTWDISAFQSVEITTLRRAVRTPADGGTIRRRQTYSSESNQNQAAVRRFHIIIGNASKGDFNKIMALWKNTTGGTQGISFTNTQSPYTGSSETIIVRIVDRPLVLQQVNVLYNFAVTLEEMLHGPGV